MGDGKIAPEGEDERTAAARMEDVKMNERVVVWRMVNGEKRRVLATLLRKRSRDSKGLPGGIDGERKVQEIRSPSANETTEELRMNSEYFVHFDGQDRRLDQWISGDQFIELAPKNSTGEIAAGDTRLTRKRRKNDDDLLSLEEPGGRADHHRKTPPERNIARIVFGNYEIQCWYYSPYRLDRRAVDRLFVCENCLLYTEERTSYACHLAGCERASPPGELIYEESDIQIFEVFGALQQFYCQRLCLLAKLFIDHKTLCFDVENFIFYLLCETDEDGTHIAAMFSKEMHSSNNLACIMTLPCYQRKGYGNLLIQLSYEMSKRAKYPGTPERPFSDLGEISYKKYWLWVLLEFFDTSIMRKVEDVTVDDLEALVGINKDDIKDTMEPIGLLSHLKGGTYIVHNPKLDQENGVERPNPPLRRLNAKYLIWSAKSFDKPKRRN